MDRGGRRNDSTARSETERDSIDEPVLASGPQEAQRAGASSSGVGERVRRLAMHQPYAVLCTQGGGQPYGSLVAIAASADLRQLAFATPSATRKYRLLLDCARVSLLIDDRSTQSDTLMDIEAVTATGRATLLEDPTERTRCATLLIDRHPHLKAFVEAPSCALFRVDVVRYFHVSAFQTVNQWIP